MSLFSQIQSAALQAQGTLAQMMGAERSTSTNFTLAGKAYQGVLNETRSEMPALAGGIEVVRQLQIVATRGQFSTKPDAAHRPVVSAYGASWMLTDVGESPLHYTFTCVPA